MNRLTAIATAFFVLINYNLSWAISTYAYNLVQESLFLLFTSGCLVIALLIYLSLKGGSLGNPWIFIVAGFAFAAVGGIINLLDVIGIFVHEYDLRPANLITACGSMLLLLLGLLLYKRNLD